MNTYNKTTNAFTLVEIIIAVSLVSLFTILPVFAYTSYLKISRDEKRKSDLNQIQSALEQYKSQNQEYPQNLSDLVEEGFLPEIPVDPKDGENIQGSETVVYGYEYLPEVDGSTYTLFGILEQNDGEKYYRITPVGAQTAPIPVGGIVTNTPQPTSTSIPSLTPSPTAVQVLSVTTLDTTGDVGRGVDMSFGADGFPIFSYYDATNSKLIFLKCADNTCVSGNTRQSIDTGSYGAAYSASSAYTSIVKDSNGNPLIAYWVSNLQSYLHAYSCNNAACSTGTATPLASSHAGIYPDITLNASNNPVIASNYNIPTTVTNLVASACLNATCTTTATNTAISGYGDRGTYNSIVSGTTPGSTPFIVFRSLSLDDLIGIKCTNETCTTSTGTTLDSNGNVGKYADAVLNNAGNPVISYYDETNANLKVIVCPNSACTGATPVTLESAGNVGSHASIAISVDGTPIISYMELLSGTINAPTSSNLKVMKCGNTACTSGNVSTEVDSGAVGMFSDIEIASDGFPVITYYDNQSNDLKYVKCNTNTCQ